MKYSVHQHWDPLKVCIVGRSYKPEFYSFIKNSKARTVMERIAEETEEDYQKLITLLKSFDVEIFRPEVSDNFEDHRSIDNKISPPPMTPRDYTAMIGDTFHISGTRGMWEQIRGTSWPEKIPREFSDFPQFVKEEILSYFPWFLRAPKNDFSYLNLIKDIENNCKNIIYDDGINTAMTTRIGKDLYFGTDSYNSNVIDDKLKYEKQFPNHRCHVINTGGHSDGTFCPVKPGLIVSLKDIPTYKDTFPDWEVIYLPHQSWDKVKPFLDLKEKNRGKWWVPGEELNDDFTNFVEQWLGHWVGYVEETVFDVNMLVIDEKNVICNNYNEKVFESFDRHGITPHICNFRHRYFWDGGLHCITSDIHRDGTQQDYFPWRD